MAYDSPPRAIQANPQPRPPLVLRDTNSLYDRRQFSPVYHLPHTDDPKDAVRIQDAPSSPVRIRPPYAVREPSSAEMDTVPIPSPRSPERRAPSRGSLSSPSIRGVTIPDRTYSPEFYPPRTSSRQSALSTSSSQGQLDQVPETDVVHNASPLQYHHQPYLDSPTKQEAQSSQLTLLSVSSVSSTETRSPQHRKPIPRPSSTAESLRGRAQEHGDSLSPNPRQMRAVSTPRLSPDSRPMSYIDMLNDVPYHQQLPPAPILDNSYLQSSVGTNASLLDTKKTLEMYRANVEKTNDTTLQYDFAIFLVKTAREGVASGKMPAQGENSAQEMIKDARNVLQKLAERGYPFAQYYLADGYASGFFNKDKIDHNKALPLFLAASKHGHAEASYRAALCYEFGWGTAKAPVKAAQFHRNAASKGHPGAALRLGTACLTGDMGLGVRYREGIKWLKRAAESADAQYNSGPYELGLLHVDGAGDDIFKDESYAAQLFTQSAELGHPQANFRMGQAYELGLLGCPKDAALSVHFYNGAASAGDPEAMLALCAWYMVGAEPVLDKDEYEAYEWAKRAAEKGFDKAEYAFAYFTEMGIGCRRDPLEANVWYVRAADHGNDSARQRLAMIRAAADGHAGPVAMEKGSPRSKELAGGKDKECIVM